MYRRNNGVFTTISPSTTAFDYLANNCVVDDTWTMQSSPNPYSGPNKWMNLYVRIGTPRTTTGLGQWEYSLGYQSGITFTPTTDLISNAGSIPSVITTGDPVEIYCTTAAPTGLTNWKTYYARKVSSSQISLHPTPGDATANTNIVNFTDAGSGTKYIFAWSVLTCTDGTAGLTAAAGLYTVAFTPPADWKAINYVNGTNATVGYYIRYRILNVGSGITEGGANSTTRVQSGNFSYTVDNYASATPASFLDVYNDDLAYARGYVIKHSSNHYSINCGLYIGGGTNETYFTDYGKIIAMGGALRIAANGHLTLGQITAAGKPYNGVKSFRFRYCFINCF
jgi:hypothetical protein